MHSPLPYRQEGPPSDQPPPELLELAADYELEGELGRGGTAVVYRARERTLGRTVAIKVIRSRYVDDEEVVARLEREARLVARLDHPNVVSLLGVRRLGRGSLALIMRYVQGHTLRAELQQRGALPLARARAVLDDVGRALAAAHTHGIVHRDVKPENIHVEHGASRALLADFGSATPLRDDLHLTVAGMAIGTPGYMAPELIDGAPATPASDVYGLGLVAWEMLAGRLPWEGDSLFAILSFRKQGELADLHSLRAEVPRTVADAVAGALRPDPAERWPDVHHFQEALARPVPRRWLPHGVVRRAPPLALPPGAGGGAPAPVTAGEQETVRLTTPVLPGPAAGAHTELPPGAGVPPASRRARPARQVEGTAPAEGAVAAEKPPGEPSPEAMSAGPHPSVAIFAADDAVLEEGAGRAAPSGGRRWLTLLLASTLVALLAAAGAALLSFHGDGAGTVAVSDTRGDRPRAVSVPSTTGVSGSPGEGAKDGSAPTPVRGSPGDESGLPGGAIERAGEVERPDVRPEPGRPGRLAAIEGTASGAGSAAAADDGRPRTAAPGARHPGAAPSSPAPRPASGIPPTPLPAATGRASGSGVPPAPAASAAAGVAAARVVEVALGGMHSCAIHADGQLDCWGADDRGQSDGPPGAARFVSVAAGLTHSCARTSDGQTLCWGSNEHGQLGDGTRGPSARAVAVRGGEGQVALALGESSTCALTRSGKVECWGANEAGQLGTGDDTGHDTPTPTPIAASARFSTVTAGWRHYCALTVEQQAYCWGDNSAGQLGDGTTTGRDTPTPVNSSLRFRTLAAGRTHSCGITTAGAVYCWGSNDAGQLGTGSRTSATTPRPTRLDGAARAMAAGSMHACALLADGSVHCWGQNRYGQLGDGTSIDHDTPVRVGGLPAVAEIEASGAHSCARDPQGQLYCWGYNVFGQLGDGTRHNRQLPVPVSPRR